MDFETDVGGKGGKDRAGGRTEVLELLPVRVMQAHTPAGGHLCYHIRGHPLTRRPTERKTELSEREREDVGKRERESPS